jgi:hypothetical protein
MSKQAGPIPAGTHAMIEEATTDLEKKCLHILAELFLDGNEFLSDPRAILKDKGLALDDKAFLKLMKMMEGCQAIYKVTNVFPKEYAFFCVAPTAVAIVRRLAVRPPTSAALQGATRAGAHHTGVSQPLKEPPKRHFDLYRYQRETGKSQADMAKDTKLMKLLGRSMSQGTISRALRRVKSWLEAGNSLPDLAKKPMPMDPERLELGRNPEHRTPRQRYRRNDDDDN